MPDFVIQTENLTRDFSTVRAVNEVSLAVPPGIVFGFLGPNGAGKTTMIRLLLGLLEPTGGRAAVLGFDTRAQAAEIRRRTGALLEHPGLYERLSAEDNLEFYGRIWRLPAAERRARIKEILSHMGLWERRKETAGKWSRGMKQKLAVARVLLHRPSLIFLDEPTAGLDPVAAAALRDDLAALTAREGVTVFLTTHNLAEAEKLCALVGVISHGKLLVSGNPDELRARSGGPRAEVTGRGFSNEVIKQLQARPEVRAAGLQNGRLYLDLRRDASMAPLVKLLVNAGVEVEEVHRGKASLEEVFLTLMEEDNEND
ncbi:ABC transporter ATP-binding protein [Desulfotomaculum copahuensis]|uniref:ABC transporter n=1 Tax=Desulfotomaculum copahuensis TaxID=1838280 RepID=A0A1B7LAJ8_9FIRM|nr:ABC transporter ATP-binding protein [Desulfotomaculum copahuensis]OAT79347.1 ABC transporter [Desulfotomaculum copahuensis]